ncbi:hypothetical protein BGS_1031 [Beggiatoa sp. SS]|nr:hypothetical protein BGS_1031 [Beggiatoa sp. SS]
MAADNGGTEQTEKKAETEFDKNCHAGIFIFKGILRIIVI